MKTFSELKEKLTQVIQKEECLFDLFRLLDVDLMTVPYAVKDGAIDNYGMRIEFNEFSDLLIQEFFRKNLLQLLMAYVSFYSDDNPIVIIQEKLQTITRTMNEMLPEYLSVAGLSPEKFEVIKNSNGEKLFIVQKFNRSGPVRIAYTQERVIKRIIKKAKENNRLAILYARLKPLWER